MHEQPVGVIPHHIKDPARLQLTEKHDSEGARAASLAAGREPAADVTKAADAEEKGDKPMAPVQVHATATTPNPALQRNPTEYSIDEHAMTGPAKTAAWTFRLSKVRCWNCTTDMHA